MDGQRLVLAAFSCNRGMTKAQRIERLDTTYKLFEKGNTAPIPTTSTGGATTNNNNNKYSKVLSDVYKKIVDHPIERAPPTSTTTTTTNNANNSSTQSTTNKTKPVNNSTTPAKSSFWG